MEQKKISTGNSRIDCYLGYEVTSRDANGYNLKYKVSFKRNNKWDGDHTHSRINYTLSFADGTNIKDNYGNDIFHVYNTGGPYTLTEGTKYISLDKFSSVTHLIGFSSSPTYGSVTGLNVKYQTASYSVDAWATDVYASTIESITDHKNNTFTIRSRTGKNGNNNNAIDCLVYGTINGKEPSKEQENHSFFYNCDGTKAEELYDKTYNITDVNLNPAEITRIYARACTISEYDRNNYNGKSRYEDISYYAPPTWPAGAKIELKPNTSKSKPKSTYTANWSGAKNSNTNSGLKGYVFKVFHKNGNIYESYLSNTTTQVDISYLTLDVKFQKGDEIYFTIQPYTLYGNGDSLYGEEKKSNIITIESAGSMRAKISDSQWVEGQVYIKTLDGWKESTGVFVKETSTMWREST